MLLDRVIIEFDKALKTVSASAHSTRPSLTQTLLMRLFPSKKNDMLLD